MRFREFIENWTSTTLGNISAYRKTRKITEKRNYVSTENILQNYQGIKRFTSAERILGDGFNENDILMANIRPYLKKIYFADFNGACNADVLVFNSKSVNPRFLYYVLANDNFINYVMSSVKGSKMPRGDKAYIMQYPVSFPNVTEQTKISIFIDAITKRIQVQNKIISKYETLIKGLMDYLFDGKGTRHFFKGLYEKAGEGGTPATDNKDFYEKGTVPFIKIEDLNAKYIVKNNDYISQLGLSKSSAWLVPANSVVYSNGATIGRIAINRYPIATKQGILGIVPSKLISTEFLYYYMQTAYFRKQIKRITVRGTMDCAYLKDINSIPCFIPSMKEQQIAKRILSLIDEKIDTERIILNKFKDQKIHLLSNLFI